MAAAGAAAGVASERTGWCGGGVVSMSCVMWRVVWEGRPEVAVISSTNPLRAGAPEATVSSISKLSSLLSSVSLCQLADCST